MSYKTSNAEGHVDFINTYDLEPMAQQVIPKAAFGYIASGAEDTFTLNMIFLVFLRLCLGMSMLLQRER
ncbi:L-lactate dehydrogenase (FMN-dependent)-like alpha-hydroxy acid dehydrogenase [Streptococcus pneumoniae]|nr:L-lactate dehydrogenase (FMN-dependent)-like alpha-hydroxy acid dehydrogenase [Streptococcus pneumoniae]